jgi:hypothetical protein
MVAVEAEASTVAAEATTKTRNIGETKLYTGNAQRGAEASRFFCATCEQAAVPRRTPADKRRLGRCHPLRPATWSGLG